MNLFHAIARKIRRRAAYQAAQRSRDAHMDAIQSRIHTARKRHGQTRQIEAERRQITHGALRAKGMM